MKYLLNFFVTFAVFFLATHSTKSYVQTPTNSTIGSPIAWNLSNPSTGIVSNGRINYSLNSAGSDDVPFSQVEQALMASFQAWEDIPTSAVAFNRGPNTTSTATANDGLFQLFWLENSMVTDDGLNLAGALAVSRVTTLVGGARSGEIIDASIVFNGNQFSWAVDGRDNAIDIREVATHEIGHTIGLSHSPIGGSTMFPRTGLGRTQGRTLALDDQIAASLAYPNGSLGPSTGTIIGRVRDNSGNNIFGAHVAAINENGIVVSGALSQNDGTYSIQGLPPGNYAIYAEPLDPSGDNYFNRVALPGFYANINVDFQTSSDLPVSVGAGSTATQDITVTRGDPALNAIFISDPTGTSFRNVPTFLPQGANNVRVGVLGPGLPQSGTPLNISGPGLEILRTLFGTSSSGLPAVVVELNVSPSAPPGSRNIIIDNGSQRTIVTGGVEIVGSAALSVVSAASFANSVATQSIASAFGQNLSANTVSATTTPLPTMLDGTTVLLGNGVGNQIPAPLFFVSPTQVNFQIPPGIPAGQTTVTVISGSAVISTASIAIDQVAPGLFAVDASGRGVAAAVALRIRADGSQSFDPVAVFDPGQNKFVAVPLDLGPPTDQLFLVLFATGIRFRGTLPVVNVGGVNCQVTFAGAQGTLVGLDQVNVRLDRSLAGRGAVNVVMTVDGKTANTVSVSIR